MGFIKIKNWWFFISLVLFASINIYFVPTTLVPLEKQTRYLDDVFEKIEKIGAIHYGSALNVKGKQTDLLMDIYFPKGDTVKNRPVILFAHGGSFIVGSRKNYCLEGICKSFAKKGYVSASIDYRLGIEWPITEQTGGEAILRAVQDGKAALRYFRKSFENGNPYQIDTANLFFGGFSAGAITALHLAYWDEYEIPKTIDQTKKGLEGGLEGLSGNAGYSSNIKAIINIDGAILDTAWMQKVDVPIISFHGTNDKLVPYESDFLGRAGFEIGYAYGSKPIHESANQKGIINCIKIYPEKGHMPECYNFGYRDSTVQYISTFLKQFVGESDFSCTY